MENLLDLRVPEELELIKVAIEQIQDWLVITDIDGVILYNNSQVEKLSGYTKEEIIGGKPSIWKSDICPRSTYTTLWNTILSGEAYYGVIANRHKDGSIFYLANTISPVKNKDNQICYFVSTAKDITQNYKLEKQLHDFMHYDAITNLPNRNYFTEIIQEEIEKNNAELIILAIHVKKLDIINSTYSFAVGDRIIKEMGERIQSVVADKHIIGRIECDMFSILITDSRQTSTIIPLIREIEKAVGEPLIVEDKELYIEVATGVAVYPSDAIEAKELIARAQTALIKIQTENGFHSYKFYTNKMNEEVEAQLYLESEIYKAYENDEFIPYFQPLINLEDNKVHGFEALMRRRNSKGDIIPPGQFIGFLEQFGLIDKIELQFIKKVCKQIRQWLDRGIDVVPVAINISPLQFRNKNLPEKIMKIINEERISPELIEIEITESLFVEDMDLAKSIVNQLRNQGISIAIDDFGTGYSSLNYLKQFNANNLKIDMSFIHEITTDKGSKAIVQAIIDIARALNMKTVAEGIETIEQLEMITSLGCNIGQGYYWGWPLPGEDIASRYLCN